MEKEKIKKLFEKYHSTCYDAMEARHVKVLLPGDFAKAINQAELEWYYSLETDLIFITHEGESVSEYLKKIQNKIKELENEFQQANT